MKNLYSCLNIFFVRHVKKYVDKHSYVKYQLKDEFPVYYYKLIAKL